MREPWRGGSSGPVVVAGNLDESIVWDQISNGDMPPKPEETTAFVADHDPHAYDALINRSLASPRYDERWGKCWLDEAGYADSNAYFNADSDRPLAYRYRDYVIRGFNADRPLDQIVREQLAGDELAGERRGQDAIPAVIDSLIATHFLRNGQDGTGESNGNPDEVRTDKYAVLEGAIQIIGSSLLGLTLQCVKCRDHKFEPVIQMEIPLLIRGDLATPGPKVGPGVPTFLTNPDNRYEPKPPFAGSSSTGRRLALAQWLTKSRSRPAVLLARVLANRIWQHHFGTGLAATSDNLGYSGSAPTYPELLDFLAAELVARAGGAKALHRLILTSSVYRRSSAAQDTAHVDPDNQWLARFPLRRLDAEAIRDDMLAVSGELDSATEDLMSQPIAPVPARLSSTNQPPERRRRSVYLRRRRTQIASLLEAFDAPSVVITCTAALRRRFQSSR